MAAASGPSGPPAGALAETLAEEDAYARELTAWHSRFVAWDAAFGVWAGDSVLVHPPKPPKTSRWSTQDEVLLSQRDGAYRAASALREAAHACWEARNELRKKETKKRSRPADAGERATQHRQYHPDLVDRHRERERKRTQERRLGPPEVRQFNYQMLLEKQLEYQRVTGHIIYDEEPDDASDAGLDSDSDSDSHGGDDDALWNVYALRGESASVYGYRNKQDEHMAAEMVAVRRPAIQRELLGRLRPLRRLETLCQAARRTLLDRAASARSQHDLAVDTYFRQYPSEETILRIHQERIAQGLEFPFLYSPTGPSREVCCG